MGEPAVARSKANGRGLGGGRARACRLGSGERNDRENSGRQVGRYPSGNHELASGGRALGRRPRAHGSVARRGAAPDRAFLRSIMKNFFGTEFRNKATGFYGPTQAPCSVGRRRAWQSANRIWWESTPMRYDWRERIAAPAGSRAYFAEI